MAFSFPAEHGLSDGVSVGHVPTGGPPRCSGRRRASMQDALDHTKINASLYEKIHPALLQQMSDTSIQEENLGSVNFSLQYDPEQAILTVRLLQARDLVPRDLTGSADPYCRVCILPKKGVQLQSKVQKNTLNPEFQEEFLFDVLPTELNIKTLELLIFNFDQFSSDECIGQVHLPLEHIDLSEPVVLWKGISVYTKDQEEQDEQLGDLMFSIGYLSSAERLTVVVNKARNLRPCEHSKNTASPFVKVSLLFAGKRLKKKKTSTKRSTTNPVWNEALVFNLGKEFLGKIEMELVLYSDSLLGNNEPLGKVILAADSTALELAHWNDMANCKNAMARWHHLKSAS
eukprot:GHVU01101310.1.p1 GENE.GHVU01101310.1~~GHVU01101310.1.p1  ORF type:complete len:344 (+),score=31.66 GHVU01101310.1:99-1130(+)